MNHLPKLPVMFIHAVCNLLCRAKNACCHAWRLKKKPFSLFNSRCVLSVTIPLAVVTAVCVTRPLFPYVCCRGDAMLLFVPSRLIQLTACKDIRTAQTCTYIKPFHTTHEVEYLLYSGTLDLSCFEFSPLKTRIKLCYIWRRFVPRSKHFLCYKYHSSSMLQGSNRWLFWYP
jgi:hypothetical protein